MGETPQHQTYKNRARRARFYYLRGVLRCILHAIRRGRRLIRAGFDAVDRLGDPACRRVAAHRHHIAYIQQYQLRRVRGLSAVPHAVDAQIVPRVPVHDGAADIGDGSGVGVGQRQLIVRQGAVLRLDEVGVQQHLPVVALALRHGAAGGHDLVLADVDHGVHLHQSRRVLQRHEIGGLLRHVQQQREGSGVLHLLHLTLGGLHGGVLLRTGHGVEPRLLGALVGQNEAHIGLVGHHGGNAGIHIYIVADGDVVIPLCSDGHLPLAEQGIPEAVDIGAVIVVLLDDQVGGIDVIHPRGDIRHVVVHRLAGDGVHQRRAGDIRAAEQADGAVDAGTDPPRAAVLVDLEGRLVKEIGGIVEPEIAVQVAAEMLGGCIADALLQPHHLHILCHHVDDEIGGQTGGTVIQPLDDVAVLQGGDADGAALVVDLGVVVGHLELGHHVRQLAQLAVAQLGGGVLVQHGDLVKGDLLHLGGEVPVFHRQQITVAACPEHLPAHRAADQRRDHQQNCQRQRDQALLFQKFEVALYAIPLKAGGHHGAQAVHAAYQQREHVEFRRFQIDGWQDDVEVNCREGQRHRQIQHRAAKWGADGLTGLGGMALPVEGILTPEALKIGIVPVGIHRVLLSVFEGVSHLRREESFALRGETLLATAPKVSKRAA